MANRFISHNFTTASVAGGANSDNNRTGMPSLLNIVKILVTQDAPGGSFDFRISKKDTFLTADLLYFADDVAPALYYPMDISSGSPAEAEEGPPIPYDDEDGTGELHIRITNNDGVAHTYTVTILYEEVPVMSSAGAVTFRSGGTFGGDVKLPATNKFYLDGGGNTYIFEDTADRFAFVAGGVTAAQLDNGSTFKPGTDNTGSLGSATGRWANGAIAAYLAFGTNPATGGEIRLPNNGQGIQARNAANSANLQALTVSAANVFAFGDAVAGLQIVGAEITEPGNPADGSFRLFAMDAGGGKTKLVAKFATGGVIQLAVEA